ncbi:transcriptional regulators [Bacillus sp. OxB-1]|uniref:FadR/GntR family transcriptional regulator n=1 Tax=Bacillus sp. (strain OxB-1) TaxID=98228 RepID=UPI000581FBA1|nr:FadR/GntR family transcriptional regulator [Bacillus sp. OxB-1]BAQ11266.1 transcriptional regulators [Bacillus sp. OxB-1]
MKEKMFVELQHTRVYEKIVEQIRGLIENGTLKPNDRLPSERELAQELGCSRTSLREACRVLESEGLIVSKAGGGRFVQEVDQRLTLTYQVNPVDLLERTAVMHFLEAREALEPKIVEHASERATEEDIVKIENALQAMKEKLKYPEEKVEADSNFHLALAEATHNFVFVSMMEMNLHLYRQVRKQTLKSADRYSESLQEHKEILDAIKAGDKNRAIQAMQNHLQHLRDNVLGFINKEE